MPASQQNFAAFLRRAGLFAAALAIIAGLFGMHVMTGAHSRHSSLGVPAIITPGGHTGAAAAAGHAVHPASGTFRAHAAAGISEATRTPEQLGSCSESGNGPYAMTGSCLPSVNTGSLSAPPPGRTVFGIIAPAQAVGTICGDRSHPPRTPSPGELSISRT